MACMWSRADNVRGLRAGGGSGGGGGGGGERHLSQAPRRANGGAPTRFHPIKVCLVCCVDAYVPWCICCACFLWCAVLCCAVRSPTIHTFLQGVVWLLTCFLLVIRRLRHIQTCYWRGLELTLKQNSQLFVHSTVFTIAHSATKHEGLRI